MNGIKLPILLLIIVIAITAFLYNPFFKKKKPGFGRAQNQPVKEKQNSSDPIEEAKKAFVTHNFQKVVDLIGNQRKSNDFEIQRMLAYSFAGLKRFDDAIVAFEKTLEQRKIPQNAYALAYLYEITGRMAVARILYKELVDLKLPPKLKKRVYEGLARTSVFTNDTKAAIKYNMEMVKRYPNSPEGFVALFKIMRNAGLFKNLDKLVVQGDKFHKNNFEYNFWLGVLYFEIGSLAKSLQRFNNCIKIDPNNSTPYYYSYRILKRQNNIEKALVELEKCYDLTPFLPHIFFEAAIDAKNEDRIDLAYKFLRSSYTMDRTLLGRDDKGTIRAIEKMIKKNGSELDQKFFTAFINYINGDHKLAHEQILQLLPEIKGTEFEVDARRILRECKLLECQEQEYQRYLSRLEQQKMLELQAMMQAKSADQTNEFTEETEAELIMRKAMINPNDLRMQYSAGLQLARIGAIEDAKRFLNNALRLNPNILEVNYSMAKILMFQEQNLLARQYIDQALKINPNHSQALSMSASLYLKEGDFSKAISDAEGALRSNPNNGEARLVLAEIAIKNNDFKKARLEINLGLDVERDPERRKRLLYLKKNLPAY